MDARTSPRALPPWIADVTLMRFDAGTPLLHLPDAATALVYRGAGADAGPGGLRVVGPRSRASYHPDKAPPPCVRARLRPGVAGPLLGVRVSELLDRSVALDDLWGERATRLEAHLDELAGADPTLRAVAYALPGALSRALPGGAEPRDALLREAVTSLSATGESVAALAGRLSVSERRLRGLFADHVGLSPKHFARVQRVRALLTGPPRADLAGLASDSGYYDQSHMTADFRLLMGVTPGAFRAGQLPAPTPCGGAPGGR